MENDIVENEENLQRIKIKDKRKEKKTGRQEKDNLNLFIYISPNIPGAC